MQVYGDLIYVHPLYACACVCVCVRPRVWVGCGGGRDRAGRRGWGRVRDRYEGRDRVGWRMV